MKHSSRLRLVWLIFCLSVWGLKGWSAELISAYLPLASENTWTLSNPFVSQPLVLRVVSDANVGNIRRVKLDFAHPYMHYVLLLDPASSSIPVEGFFYAPVTYRYAEPADLFKDAPDGATWTNALGTIKLVTSSATVQTPGKTYTGCRHYQIIGANNAVTDWYLAPNIGFVQFGSGPSAFVLASYQLNTYVPPPAPVYTSGPCPRVGVDADTGAMAAIYPHGARFAHVNATWQELEPQPGVYSLSKIRNWAKAATNYNIDFALTLRAVDTVRLTFPSDLAGRTLDDPVVITRFLSLLQALAPVLNSHAKWIEVGNEVDTYFGVYPNQLAQFQTFYAQAASKLHSLLPGVRVGTVFAYPSTRMYDAVFQVLKGATDHIAFSYYALNGDFAQRSPSVVSTDIADMIAMAGGKDLVLTEIGFSSGAAANGSTALQQTFYTLALTALQNASGNVTAANFYNLMDPPPSALTAAADYYGQQNNPQFLDFLGYLGILTSALQPKPAWSTWRTYALQFSSSPSACNAPM